MSIFRRNILKDTKTNVVFVDKLVLLPNQKTETITIDLSLGTKILYNVYFYNTAMNSGPEMLFNESLSRGFGAYSSWVILWGSRQNLPVPYPINNSKFEACLQYGNYYIKINDETKWSSDYLDTQLGNYECRLFGLSSGNRGINGEIGRHFCVVYNDNVVEHDYSPIKEGDTYYIYDEITEDKIRIL